MNHLLSLLFAMIFATGFAQNTAAWRTYPSFVNISAISPSASAVLACTENSLLSVNLKSGQTSAFTTIDGLSGQNITAMYHSNIYNYTFVGYQDGLIIAIGQDSGKFVKIVDIVNNTLHSNEKRINHFSENEHFLYVSCNFGIVQLNMETLKFGDTYYIGDAGEEQSVRQTAIFNNFIFACTATGIKKASLDDTHLIDFAHWQKVATGDWFCISAFANNLYASEDTGLMCKFIEENNTFVKLLDLGEKVSNLNSEGDYLAITCPKSISIYNPSFINVRNISNTQLIGTYTAATVIAATVYIGTTINGFFESPLTDIYSFRRINPDGPQKNSVFCMKSTASALWLGYGDYDEYYNPYPLDEMGISVYQNSIWGFMTYDNISAAKSIVKITANPFNQNQVYLSSYFSGLVRVENNATSALYNQTNSPLESAVITPPDPSYIDIRINGTAFDGGGSLWVTNSRSKNGLKSLSASGQWQSYNLESVLAYADDNDFNQIQIDKNNIKWLSTSKNGVVAVDTNTNIIKKLPIGTEQNTLPVENVRSIAIDKSDMLWIGTSSGLRVLEDVDSFKKSTLYVSSIIINENNTAQELLYEQFITDIVVDGDNNKWIGTSDSGVYLVSPNGLETLQHFNTENSPLPSNNINDIEINNTTGEVYIATSAGLMGYMSNATEPKESLATAFVFPNPVRPEHTDNVKISGLMNKANVKVTDIEGNLVFEAYSTSGTVEWNTTAFGNYKVASGVYIILITSNDGKETKVLRLMIIR